MILKEIENLMYDIHVSLCEVGAITASGRYGIKGDNWDIVMTKLSIFGVIDDIELSYDTEDNIGDASYMDESDKSNKWIVSIDFNNFKIWADNRNMLPQFTTSNVFTIKKDMVKISNALDLIKIENQ